MTDLVNKATSVFSGFMPVEATLEETNLFVDGTQDLQIVRG